MDRPSNNSAFFLITGLLVAAVISWSLWHGCNPPAPPQQPTPAELRERLMGRPEAEVLEVMADEEPVVSPVNQTRHLLIYDTYPRRSPNRPLVFTIDNGVVTMVKVGGFEVK